MTELDLYKFVTERECEYHWTYHIDGIHPVLFISPYDLKDFARCLVIMPLTTEDLRVTSVCAMTVPLDLHGLKMCVRSMGLMQRRFLKRRNKDERRRH